MLTAVRYRALASDYDGTLAVRGHVEAGTVDALKRLRKAGWKFLLVTGRELDDLRSVFPEFELCDRVVAENGALVAGPEGAIRSLGEAPPAPLLEALRRRGVAFRTGRVVVSTFTSYEAQVAEALDETHSRHHVSLNKGALMLLPEGIDKAAGLRSALQDLDIPLEATVAVGDAENDIPFLQACGLAVACCEALPGNWNRDSAAEPDWPVATTA